MPIDDTTTATTQELCQLLSCTKGHLSHLARDGVISPLDRNSWPLVKTVRAVLDQVKARRSAVSQAQAKWQAAKIRREELRYERESHDLVRRSEFSDAWTFVMGVLTSKLVAVPARCSRDITMRSTIEREINQARHEACDEYDRQATSLEQTGKMAVVR